METRYKDNDNGTTTDNKTGLVWQDEHAGPMPWQEAMEYAKDLTLAGHKDWRLPTVQELFALVDFSKAKPASDFPGMPPEYFWSSTSDAVSSSFAWLVYFYNGHVFNDIKASNYCARCVRGGEQ